MIITKEIIEECFKEMFDDCEGEDLDYYTASLLRNKIYEKARKQYNDYELKYGEKNTEKEHDYYIDIINIEAMKINILVNNIPRKLDGYKLNIVCKNEIVKEDIFKKLYKVNNSFAMIKSKSKDNHVIFINYVKNEKSISEIVNSLHEMINNDK